MKLPPFQFRLRTLFGVLLLAGIVLALVARPMAERRRREQCRLRLRQIALAMHQYNDDFGTFPPAYVTDENGNPRHSWRVLLLPYLGPRGVQTYRQYDFSEPWDGPHNRLLANRMPEVYACPADRNRGNYDTSYLVVTGKETVFKGSQSMSFDQVAATDGLWRTLLVAECAESGVQWMEPRDLRHAYMTFRINDHTGKRGVRSHHGAGANVAMANANVEFVPENVDTLEWQARFTASAGDGAQSPY